MTQQAWPSVASQAEYQARILRVVDHIERQRAGPLGEHLGSAHRTDLIAQLAHEHRVVGLRKRVVTEVASSGQSA